MTLEDVTAALRAVLAEARVHTDLPPDRDPLPSGVRLGLRRLQALLLADITLDEACRLSETWDLRDLNEFEVAYLEQRSVKTIRKWRQDGRGPEFRAEGGVSYPLRAYLRWRERGLVRSTSGATR
jgi:hypothetical protein